MKIVTIADGIVSPLLHGLRTIIDSQYLDDLKIPVRRGMSGVICDGRHAGGAIYGYRSVLGKPGELEIVPEQATIIRRIFSDYVSGQVPRAIAAKRMFKTFRRPESNIGALQQSMVIPNDGPASSRMSFIADVLFGIAAIAFGIPIPASASGATSQNASGNVAKHDTFELSLMKYLEKRTASRIAGLSASGLIRKPKRIFSGFAMRCLRGGHVQEGHGPWSASHYLHTNAGMSNLFKSVALLR